MVYHNATTQSSRPLSDVEYLLARVLIGWYKNQCKSISWSIPILQGFSSYSGRGDKQLTAEADLQLLK
jgi:hypothetical protein